MKKCRPGSGEHTHILLLHSYLSTTYLVKLHLVPFTSQKTILLPRYLVLCHLLTGYHHDGLVFGLML